MADDRGVLRRIVWRDVFPGLMLFRCFRLSITLPVLFLATVGTLLMPIGPWLSGKLFPPQETLVAFPDRSGGLDPGRTEVRVEGSLPAAPTVVAPIQKAGWPIPRLRILDVYLALYRPFFALFDRDASFGQMVGSLGVVLWYLLVWSAFGAAITRIAVVQLGCHERVSLAQVSRYVSQNLLWYFASPLFPLLGVALLAVPFVALGFVMRLDVGVFLAGFLWPLALFAGFISAILLTGLLFGWPLMWPTISSEAASDSFQAFSSSFSYTFQRPLQYLAYATIAILLGALGGLFVEGFAQLVIAGNHWAISCGLSRERLAQLLSGELNDTWMVWTGTRLMSWGDGLVRTIAKAYYFSFLFCSSSAIYLLLRREVDQTDFDEVYLPEEAGTYSLPTLRPGPHGVPEVEESAPPTTTDQSESAG